MTVDALSADVNSIEQRILTVSDGGWLGETRDGRGSRGELMLRFDVEVEYWNGCLLLCKWWWLKKTREPPSSQIFPVD